MHATLVVPSFDRSSGKFAAEGRAIGDITVLSLDSGGRPAATAQQHGAQQQMPAVPY